MKRLVCVCVRVQAKCRVLHSRKTTNRPVGQAVLEDRLRFDADSKTITAGSKSKIKLSDLEVPPQEANGEVQLVSRNMRIVTDSTTDSRELLASVKEAYRLESGGGGGGGRKRGGGSGGGGTPRTKAFKPLNTLNLVSRPPAQASRGGKRGKNMASVAAAAGGAAGGDAKRHRSALGGMGAMSSGTLYRGGKGLERGGSGNDRRGYRPSCDDEELSEAEEANSNSNTHNSNNSNSSSNNSGRPGIRNNNNSGGGGGGGGGGRCYGSGVGGRFQTNRRRREAGIGGTSPAARDNGGSPPAPPLLKGAAAAAGRRGGIHSKSGSIESCWNDQRGRGGGRGQQLTRYMTHREPLSRREGFRNMGNTCYLNACLQGLLSLSGFVGDLRRKCWVLAMLKPPPPAATGGVDGDLVDVAGGGNGGGDDAIDIRDSPHPRAVAVNGDDDDGGDIPTPPPPPPPILYEALLRLSLEARGSHGVMDASPLKRAMDRHSDRFAGNLQQDAHEFLGDLVNVLHEETQPRLDIAVGYVGKPLAAAAAAAAVGGGGDKGKNVEVAVGAERSGRTRKTSSGGGGGDGGVVGGGGGGGSGDSGGGVTMVDLSSTDSGDEGREEPDVYGGGWDDGEDFAAAAEAAAAAASASATASGSAGSGGGGGGGGGSGSGSGGGGGGGGVFEVFDLDSDGSCSDDDRNGASAAAAPKLLTTTTTARGETRTEGGDEDGEGPEGGREDEETLRQKERLMPTTRHFHAEVEATLTCTKCSYSRRRRELYRDFSLDVPEPARRKQQQQQERGGGGGRTGGGGDGGVSGLGDLLDNFFQPSELSLRCERCGHDRVRAEHSLAELPGALVLHIKRFKPAASAPPPPPPPPPPKAKVVDSASEATSPAAGSAKSPLLLPPPLPPVGRPSTAPAAGVPSPEDDAGCAATVDAGGSSEGVVASTPPVAVVGGGSTGASSRSGSSGSGATSVTSGGGGGGSRSYGGVSYVKLASPVAVPLELDLERFCSGYTGNAPAEDLGKQVDSLDGLGILPRAPRSPSAFASLRAAGTGLCAAIRAAPKPAAAASSSGGGGRGGGGEKRASDDVSVDLFAREGWSSTSSLTSSGRDGGGKGGGGGSAAPGVNRRALGRLGETTNGSSGGGGIGNRRRGIRETVSERRERVAKEKENSSAAAGGGDRWANQDETTSRNRSHKLLNNVCLGPDGKVDYLDTLRSLSKPNSAGGLRDHRRSPLPGVGLSPLGGTGRGSGRLFSGGGGGGRRSELGRSDLRVADHASAGLLAQREFKRKRRQEIDDDNEQQV
ncbi:unnamed protein product [Ectocarpus sp. 8 AP-2014]